MEIGDVVIPNGNYPLASGCGRYNCAIVANMEPFALVSVEGDMLWANTVKEHDFTPLCQASYDIIDVAVQRYAHYIDTW